MIEPAPEAVVIGASAGAVEALSRVLPALPPEFPLAVLIVVHVPPDRPNQLIPLFRQKCRLPVLEAEDKAAIRPGTIYFAPSDYHLLVEGDGSFSLSSDVPVQFARPSIDVLFESAADAYGPALVGVILTGANHDGATGLKAVADAGGLALVEDPAAARASDMPGAALRACGTATVLPLDDIASFLSGLGRTRVA